jgi:hypothetical protein
VEAVGLPDHQEAFIAETGIEMTWILALFQDWAGKPPVAADAVDYAKVVGDPPYPVIADYQGRLTEVTPWTGQRLPGKCVLSPQMEILDCYNAVDNTRAFDAIKAHHAAADR